MPLEIMGLFWDQAWARIGQSAPRDCRSDSSDLSFPPDLLHLPTRLSRESSHHEVCLSQGVRAEFCPACELVMAAI